jgi:4-amino-4-deoxy-L-arabinose transferase-like glycosyltransferase
MTPVTRHKEGKPTKISTTHATGGNVAGLVVWIRSVPTSFWLVIGLAALVRLWGIWNLSVEHFDEGVYASNIWFGADQGYEYPARFFYAPPLWPLVLEWTQLIGGMLGLGHPGWLVMLPGILCGIALCGVIYSFGKEFFTEQVGLLAGLMAACSDLLASYSRTALTDTPVTLCMLLAVRAMVRSLTAPTWGTIVAAGAWTALAWSIKYSGWLPLAILLASEFAGWFLKCHVLPVARVQKITLTICAIAIVLWLPVLWGLQATGGYQTVSTNHAQYVTGPGQWFTQFQSQWETIRHYSANMLIIILPLIVIIAGRFRLGGLTLFHCDWIFLLCAIAWNIGDLSIWILFGILGACWGIVRPQFAEIRPELPESRPTQRIALVETQRLALLFLLIWILGLLVTIPLYRAYPRLLTPIYPPSCLAFAYGYHRYVVYLINRYSKPQINGSAFRSRVLSTSTIALATTFLIAVTLFGVPRAWQDRTAILETSRSFQNTIRQKTPSGQPAIAYIYGEPAVFWALKSLGFDLAGPVQDLGFVDNDSPAEVWLVVGPHARRSEQFREQWELHGDSFIKEAEASARVSDIVRRDDESREETALFELHRLRRAGS